MLTGTSAGRESDKAGGLLTVKFDQKPNPVITQSTATFTIQGSGVTQYKYKFGFSASIDCSVDTDYTQAIPVSAPIVLSLGLGDGVYTICALAGSSDNVWQSLSQPLSYTWKLDSTGPALSLNSPVANGYFRYDQLDNHPIEIACSEADQNVAVTLTSAVSLASLSGNGTCVGGKVTVSFDISTFPDGAVTLVATQTDTSGNTGSTGNVTLIKDPAFEIADLVFNPSTTSVNMEWGIRGNFFADTYTLAYTAHPASAPADCATGTVIADIPGAEVSQVTVSGLSANTLYKFRLCPDDNTGAPIESKAAYIEVNMNQTNSLITPIYSEPDPTSGKSLTFGTVTKFVGDTNGDGFDDVVYRDSDPRFRVLAGGGSNAKILNIAMTSSDIWRTGDINGDGREDYVLGDPATNSVRIANATNGALLMTVPIPTGVSYFGSDVFSLGDFNTDGVADYWIRSVVNATSIVRYYIISGANGAELGTINAPNATDRFQLYDIGDFNGDGVKDYAQLEGRSVSVRNRSGAIIQNFNLLFDLNWEFSDIFPLGDLNGDGKVEIAAKGARSGSSYMHILSSTSLNDRVTIFRSPVGQDSQSTLWSIQDLNADSIPEYFYSNNASYALIDGKTGAIYELISQGPAVRFGRVRGRFNNDAFLDYASGAKVYTIQNAF